VLTQRNWCMFILSVTLLLSGCGDSNSSPLDSRASQPPALAPKNPLNVLVSQANGDLTLLDDLFWPIGVFESGANQGITIDALGTGYHNLDSGIRVLDRPVARIVRGINPSFTTLFERDIDLALPGESALKGSDLAQRQGYLIVADHGMSQLVVTSTSGTLPLAITATPSPPWDVAYDSRADRLFVSFTNGTVGIYDNWSAGGFGGPPTRVVEPVGLDNAYGIAYHPESDTLIVSDVGSATGTPVSDGEIFFLPNASSMQGRVSASFVIRQLFDPVDIDLRDGDLRVADKTNDTLLVFANVLGAASFTPAQVVTAEAPESITSEIQAPLLPDNSDIDGGIQVQNLIISTNPEGLLYRIDPSLSGTPVPFTPGFTPESESVKVDRQGDVFLTIAGGFVHLARVAGGVRDSAPTFSAQRDRQVPNATTDPKGFDIVDEVGILIIADFGTSQVSIYGKQADGETVASADTPGPPWDVDYDTQNDRLYVALTDGSVAVYDTYLANPFQETPSRLIQVASATNLHGIVHDVERDLLLLSDVGEPMSASDGKLFVVGQASTAQGTVVPTIEISGNLTQLGNPVDIAYDGNSLFVAEKANGLVLRFDDIRASTGGNVAPTAVLQGLDGAESVGLITGL
jgi:uncharacterized protein YuzE